MVQNAGLRPKIADNEGQTNRDLATKCMLLGLDFL